MYRHWVETGFMPLALWETRRENPLYQLFFEGEPPSFEQYVEHELELIAAGETALEPSIIRRGLYADQVGRYLDRFGANKMLILGFRDLIEQPEQTTDMVAEFAHAGNREAPPSDRSVSAHNTGSYPSKCPEHVAHRLAAFYQPHNERLWQLLGREVRW